MAYVGTYRALLSGGVSRPALVLDFIGLNVLDRRITFTRGSNATLTDSTGKITYAPANLVTYSEQFDNAAWTKSNSTVTQNAATAPDGTTTADKLIASAAAAIHYTDNATNFTGTYLFSVYAKAAEYTTFAFARNTDSSAIKFDLSNGTVLSTGSAWSSATITSVGNGWYRCSGIITLSAARVYISPNTAISFTGDGTSGVYIWGAQLEPVTYQTTPSTYQATTSTAYYGPRFDYDPVTLAAKGLLIEEQRTNLLLRSEEFNNAAWTKSGATITENAINSPNGTVNADTLVEDTSNGSHQGAQGVNFASGVTYTFSVYAKYLSANRFLQLIFSGPAFSSTARAVFDLSTGASAVNAGTASATSIGNGWWRCSFTVSATSTTSSNINIALANTNAATFTATQYTGDGTSGIYIWGAQLEAGSFATSYIPTVSSTATRSADVATMTGSNFSAWYNQTAGTFVAVFDCSGSSSAISADDGTNNNFIRVGRLNTTGRLRVFSGGVEMADVTPVNSAGWAGSVKVAAAYKANDFAASASGGSVGTDTAGTIPAVTQIRLGTSGAGDPINGHLRTLTYFNTRLPNAQLVQLTS